MTDAQRTTWNIAAQQFTTRARLGNEPVSDGFNYFVRFNMYLLMAGLSMTTTPGRDREVPFFRTFIPRTFTNNISYDYTASFASSDYKQFAYCSPPISPGRMSVNSTQLLFINASTVFSGLTVNDLYTDWSTRFGDPADWVGYKVFFGVRIMSVSTGSLSPMRIGSSIIT
jgi:hypothetical protein